MLLDSARKVLFAGDTLRFDDGKVVGAPNHFTWDGAKERESVSEVAKLDFEVMLPGHGDFLKSGASEMVRAYAAALK